MSVTENITVEISVAPEFLMPITCGVADTNEMLPVAAGEMETVVRLLTPLATAEIVTEPALLVATNVVVAIPPTVEPTVFDKAPKVLSPSTKLTVVPSGTDLLFPVTIALKVVVPYTVMVAGFADRLTVSGGGDEIVTVVDPDTPPVDSEAVTITGETIFFAVSVTETFPPAPVTAEAADNVAIAGLFREKSTVRPLTGPA
jgi:hypothetical protein